MKHQCMVRGESRDFFNVTTESTGLEIVNF